MIKVGIKIGHTESAKGAYSTKLGMSEWDYNLKVGKELVALSDNEISFEVFTFDKSIGSYTKRQQTLADIMNKKNFDIVIELHFDSAESQTARGTTALYFHKSKNGQKLGKYVGDQIAKDFSSNRRSDIALIDSTQNGYQAVVCPKPPAIIIEPFFGNNPLDAVKFEGKDKMIKYASSIKQGVKNYFIS